MKILIAQTGKIGDTVLTTPLIRELATSAPDAEIHLLVSHRGLPVVDGNPRLRKILLYRKDPFRLLLLLLRIWIERYDVLIDPKDHYSREGSLLATAIRSKIKIGFNQPGHRVFSHGLSSQDDNFAFHVTRRNLHSLKHLGITVENDCFRPELFPDPEITGSLKKKFATDTKRYVLLNISAGKRSRLWETEKWALIAGKCRDAGLCPIVCFSPSDEVLARDLQRMRPEVELFFSTSIREVIAFIPCVRLIITPDTSIVHIASAFNTPTIALYPHAEWNYHKFRPLSDVSITLRPAPDQALSTIGTEQVEKALDTVLRQLPVAS